MPKGWGNLLTFSDGPRNCVGQRLGEVQSDISLPPILSALRSAGLFQYKVFFLLNLFGLS
jgi:cytochrome P450